MKKALLLLLALGAPFAATAFVTNRDHGDSDQRWNLTTFPDHVHPNVVNRTTKAIRYYIGSNTYSAANREAEINAIRASFDQWQSIPGTIIKFEEAGLMSGNVDVNTSDNTNVVYWVKGTTVVNGGRDDLDHATGVTFSSLFLDGTLAEADIVLNGQEIRWYTEYERAISPTETFYQFVESVVSHEIGHMLGLHHSPAGGSTMYFRGGDGLNAQAGLSIDEINGARWLYPASGTLAGLGRVTGTVTKNGNGVFGASVVLENAAGNLVAATVTRNGGGYDMQALPPGQYSLRVCPFDRLNAVQRLLTAADIANTFLDADTTFLATTNIPVTVTAGAAASRDVAVAQGSPALHIASMRPPSADPNLYVINGNAMMLRQGLSNVWVGVYSYDLFSGVTLSVSGDGVTVGPSVFRQDVFPNASLVTAQVTVAPNATPGLRTLMVQFGNHRAYANGYFEVLPPVPDSNFDGLDDIFQRRNFARFTSAEAGPSADPDGDGFSNTAEYIAGTIPSDGGSVLRIESARQDAAGTTLTWASAPGKKYQLQSRSQIAGSEWQTIRAVITSTGMVTQYLDASAPGSAKFYRLMAVP